jgi:cytochrome c oxidase subunit II
MSRMTTRRMCARGAIPLASLIAAACTGGVEYVQTTFHPVSEYGLSLNRVFVNTLVWTMAILAVVIVLVIVVIIRFRERPGQPPPKQIHGNTLLEISWTLIPAVIVSFIAVPTVQTIFSSQRPAVADALEIEVVGHQWWWEFRYPAEGVTTANQFEIPVGREVHLRLNSADVIHSFWIPRIGGKRDVIPTVRAAEGENPRPNHLVFTVTEAGEFRGQCAEFCGEAHAIMAMYADAVSPADFDAWVASMKAPAPVVAPTESQEQQQAAAAAGAQAAAPADSTPAGPMTLEQQGRQIFLGKLCTACHTIAGTTATGALGPNLTRVGARRTVGAGAAMMSVESLERWIRNPQLLKAGALMPGVQNGGGGFPPTGLTEEEIHAVATYLFSLK